MDAKVKAKWLKALRSGDYAQGKSRLRTRGAGKAKDKFCCLGVLCDITDPDKWYEVKNNPWHWNGSKDLLPMDFRLSLDIDGGVQRELVDRNDRGDSFATIADYIQENL